MKLSLLSIAAYLSVAASSFAGLDLGSSASRTPYDSYMGPVRQVLSSLDSGAADMQQVRSIMRETNNFRYSFTEPYTAATPEVTAARRAGDCKAKSLYLINKMDDPSVRFVVGKAHRNSKLSHAWVVWKNEGRWWILDPTNTSVPIAADRVSSNDYIPLYSWSKGSVYHHSETSAYLAGIAGKRKAPVAGKARRP